MTVHYLPNARPEPAAAPARDEARARDRERRSPGTRAGGRSAEGATLAPELGGHVDARRARAARRGRSVREYDLPTPEPADDNTAWLLTFSDLVILLFGFVVLSFAAKRIVEPPHASRRHVPVEVAEHADVTTPQHDGEDVARSETAQPQRALPDVEHIGVVTGSPIEAELPTVDARAVDVVATAPEPEPAEDPARERFTAVARYLDEFSRAAGIGDAITIAADQTGVELALGSELGFSSGHAELATAALPLLREVGVLVRGMPDLVLEVSGHTDSTPVHTRAYPSNLELSLARAARVARAIAGDDAKVAARIATAGFADHRAIASNTLASERARNRRVELRLVRR